MKHIVLVSVFLLSLNAAHAQFVAKVMMEQEVPGLCSQKDVYTLLPGFKGQVEPEHPLTKEGIVQKLNSALKFLKEHPKHRDTGIIGLYINCEGRMVKSEMDRKTSSSDLDAQLLTFFNTLSAWKPGTLNGQAVDTYKMFTVHIRKGRLTLSP